MMQQITGVSREQITLFPESVDEYIPENNPVRFIDAFVDQLDTVTFGFQHATIAETGRPPYNPKDPLKLYLYGYLNRIRSSRLLERETTRNLEVFWLLKRLSPDHKTISDFRKNNAEALRRVFKEFIQLCKTLELFGNELIGIDSSKFKAQNARDRIKDSKGLEKSISRINESITQYLHLLDENDSTDDSREATSSSLTKEELQKKIAFLQQQVTKLETAKTELQKSGEEYISLTDPDCRLIKDRQGIEPGYRMHIATDAQHSLIVDYDLTHDAADNHHLSTMANKTKDMLGIQTMTACADAGFYDSVDLKLCEENNITTYVPIPKQKVSKKTNVPTPDYHHQKFQYDSTTDTYRCPQGQTLHRYSHKTKKKDQRLIYIYRTDRCIACPARNLCTTSTTHGRYIHRWEHEATLDRLKERLTAHPEIIKRRKELVEHPFGTLKRIWGYGTFLLRGLNNIASEVALMNLTYNIKRVLSIKGTTSLINALQSC